MNKLLAITFKDMRTTFTDRSLLLLMFAAPLAIATIIAVTFGGILGDDAPLQNIPVAIVNLDEGSPMNNGAVLVNIFIPSAEGGGFSGSDCGTVEIETEGETGGGTGLGQLVAAVELDDPNAARAGVEDGTYAAAIIIPNSFSADLGYSALDTTVTPTQVEVYGDPERPIAAQIVSSIVQGILTQIANGNIAIAATMDTVISDYGVGRTFDVGSSEAFNESIGCAFSGGVIPISIDRQTVAGEDAGSFNPLVLFGAGQAIFFALFTANGSATSIMEERRNWTLQRLAISPTSRFTILFGKMTATFAIVLTQLLFLTISFTLVASILQGELYFIWGTNVFAVFIVLIASSLAATGLGAIVAAASRTPEQSNVVGNIVSLLNGVAGGAFGFSVGAPLQFISVIYWGTDAFTKLAQGQGNYELNVLILIGFGAIAFGLALFIFNRKLAE